MLDRFILDVAPTSAATRSGDDSGNAADDGDRQQIVTVAVAYSGGADSTVLLHVLAGLRAAQSGGNARLRPIRRVGGFDLIALHVHHGLSPHADDWLTHCASQCELLGVRFDHARVAVAPHSGESLEAAARHARYTALEALCQRHGATVLMTAHHATDQAETVLLNLLRGAGVAGLSGMAPSRAMRFHADSTLADADTVRGGKQDIRLCRPFLGIPGTALRAHAQSSGWRWIEDESNLSPRFARNALRHRLMPVLHELAPGATLRLAQTAQHAAQAQELLAEIGHEDLRRLRLDKDRLDLGGLQGMSLPRAANVLRTWFDELGLYRPDTTALHEMLKQLRHSPADGNVRLHTQDHELRIYRGSIQLLPVVTASQPGRGFGPGSGRSCPPPATLHWNGEDALEVPAWGGRLRFAVAPHGLSAAWLRTTALSVRGRHGGERLKLHPSRPSRTLKNLYQEHGIPPWQRERLPLVYAGERIIFAGGLGMDTRLLQSTPDEHRIVLGWESRG